MLTTIVLLSLLQQIMTPIENYEYFKKDLETLNDEALIARFNQSVKLRAFGVARQGYLKALRASLDQRNIDYSAIGNHQTMRFDHKVQLVGKRMAVEEWTLIPPSLADYSYISTWNNLTLSLSY